MYHGFVHLFICCSQTIPVAGGWFLWNLADSCKPQEVKLLLLKERLIFIYKLNPCYLAEKPGLLIPQLVQYVVFLLLTLLLLWNFTYMYFTWVWFVGFASCLLCLYIEVTCFYLNQKCSIVTTWVLYMWCVHGAYEGVYIRGDTHNRI